MPEMVIRLDTRKLDEIADKLGQTRDQVLKNVAFEVESQAKINAPVDTGNLRASINTEKIEDGVYHVSDGVTYGIYQELGPSGSGRVWKYKPFMRPAVEAVAMKLKSMWEEALK